MSEKRVLRNVFATGLLLAAPLAFACTTDNWRDRNDTPHVADPGVIEAGELVDGHQIYESDCSLGVTPDGTARFVEDGSPSAEPVLVARLYIYLRDLTLSAAESFTAFEAFNASDTSELAVDVTDTTGSQDYEVSITAAGQSTSGDSIPLVTPAANPGPVQWSMLQVTWNAEDGTVDLLVNGEQGTGLSLLDTSGNRIEYIQMGDITGLNAVGTVYFDAYASRRSGSPGLENPGDSNMDGFYSAGDMIQIQQMINTPIIPFHGPANCNGDGVISVGDMICLQNAINAG